MSKAKVGKPRIFIGSSVEGLDIAYSIQESLEFDAEATVWDQGVFDLSRYTLESLLDVLAESDFAIFVFKPDDVAEIREETKKVTRDNVVFELGLFVGRIGKERCFIIIPRGVEGFHMPTDLLGITPAQFEPEREDGNLVAALGPACQRIKRTIKSLGRLNVPSTEAAPEVTSAQEEDELTSDPEDCKSLIQSWMGARSTADNQRAIRYADVDRDLKLTPGSAEQFIEEAAARWKYAVERKGKDIILFRKASRTVRLV